jgi:DNA-binding NtrC family response regulator
LSGDAFQCLTQYDWPGNILQLSSVVTHAVLLARDEEIGPAELEQSLGEAAPRGESETISVPLAGGLREIERKVIETVIERCRGNKAAAARALGLHRRTLYRILQDETQGKKNAAALPLVLDAGLSAFAAVMPVS